MSEPAPAPLDRRDLAVAGGCALASLVAYVLTLAPGLTADTDAAVFQLVGRVLGIAHNPGYPLYTLLTWPIARLPIGTLAWRINLFSAVTAAAAVGLTVLGARRLGCGRLVAAFAGLGLAAGGTFWAQAVVAEVYGLHLALIAMLLQCAFAWSRTLAPRYFYGAVACLAIGLAHHTTIAAFAPWLAVQALIVDRRFALRPRTIAIASGIVLAGLAPYLLVLVRSHDPSAYVESRATSLSELAGVMLAQQFRDRVFGDSWTAVLSTGVPDLVRRVVLPDLSGPGVVLAAIGAAWLLRRRPADAVLVIGGALLILIFAAGYAVVDSQVFVLPALPALWLLAAAGLWRLSLAVDRLSAWRMAGIAGRVAIGVTALALPLRLAVTHAPRVDRSGDRDDAAHVERLVAAAGDRTAFVCADFISRRMLFYELLGRGAAAGRDLRVLGPVPGNAKAMLADGVRVIALQDAARSLRVHGLDVSFEPLRLVDGTLDRFVSRLPRGTVVAAAVPRAHVRGFSLTARAMRARLGIAADWGTLATADHVALGVVGGAARTASSDGGASLAIAPGDAPWPGRTVVQLDARTEVSVVRVGGRDLLRTTDGITVAVWPPDASSAYALALLAKDGYQVPLRATALSAFEVRGPAETRAIPPGSEVDVSSVADRGVVSIDLPAGGRVELAVEDEGLLLPSVVVNEGGALVQATPRGTAAKAVRVTIDAGGRPAAVLLALGGVPMRATARWQPAADAAAQPPLVGRVALDGLARSADGRSALLTMTRDDQVLLVGAGWSLVEADDAGPYRWMETTEARLVVPPAGMRWGRVTLAAYARPEAGAATVTLRIDGVELPALPLQPGWHDYAWTLPERATDALVRASTEITVVTTAAAGRSVAVASLRLSG